MYKIIFLLGLFIFSNCSNNNLTTSSQRVKYFAAMINRANIGDVLLESPIMLWEINDMKKDKEKRTYYKAYFLQDGSFYTIKRIEKYNTDIEKPIAIFWFDKNNINYKVEYYKNNTYISCAKKYSKKGKFNIQEILCNDKSKKIITYEQRNKHIYADNGAVYQEQAYPISKISFNKTKKIIQKILYTKKGIQTYENNKISFREYEVN